jgi:hypothetical protein
MVLWFIEWNIEQWLSSMFSPCPILTPSPQKTLGTSATPRSTHGPEKNICDFILKLVSDVNENNMLMQHLLVDLKQVARRQQILVA